MILGNPKTEGIPATTLDDMFRRTVAQRPDAVALADPPTARLLQMARRAV